MKTTVITREQLTGNVKNSQNGNGKGKGEKVNGLQPSNEFDKKAEEPKPQGEESAKPTVETPQAEQPKAEPTKAEIKEQLKEKKAPLNLDSTIKLIETLHRRKIQRDKLIDTIDTLEAFEVAQLDDADETDTHSYQRCVLTIEDDKGNEFSTKNPFIINAVAEYVNGLCVNKLAEIEAGISIPA